MKPLFREIPFFVYPVRDMARSKQFYNTVLGLREVYNWENTWVEFDLGADGGPVIALATEIDGAQPGAKAGAVGLESDCFDEAVRHLRSHGVRFIFGPTDTGVCDFARFEDPDGNHLVLHRKH